MSVITNAPMPKLAPTDIVKLRNGKYGIILYNTMSGNLLSIFTQYDNKNEISCCDNLFHYNENINITDRSHDIIAIWKSNAKTQFECVKSFFHNKTAPEYLDPTWTEPSEMTLKEIEKIVGHPFTIIEEEETNNE